MWQTKPEKFTTNGMATVDFCLPGFSALKIATQKCHVDDSTKIRYTTIPGRYLITALGLGIKFYKHVIIGGDGTYK